MFFIWHLQIMFVKKRCSSSISGNDQQGVMNFSSCSPYFSKENEVTIAHAVFLYWHTSIFFKRKSTEAKIPINKKEERTLNPNWEVNSLLVYSFSRHILEKNIIIMHAFEKWILHIYFGLLCSTYDDNSDWPCQQKRMIMMSITMNPPPSWIQLFNLG